MGHGVGHHEHIQQQIKDVIIYHVLDAQENHQYRMDELVHRMLRVVQQR